MLLDQLTFFQVLILFLLLIEMSRLPLHLLLILYWFHLILLILIQLVVLWSFWKRAMLLRNMNCLFRYC